MGSHNGHGKISKKNVKNKFPQIYVDKDLDFASIKLSKGIEEKSYEKDGFIFCEDKKGNIIEIQILNLSDLKKLEKFAA